MPVVHFYVPDAVCSDAVSEEIVSTASRILSGALNAPIDRVRAYLNRYPDVGVCAGGAVLGKGGVPAPFYRFYVLADRSAEQVAELHRSFTALLSETLGVDSSIVRGVCLRVQPDDWAIGGHPASHIRRAELDTRRVDGS